MKSIVTIIFGVMCLCAAVMTAGQVHPAVIVAGGSYGCNCPALNWMAARECCTTVGTCCLSAGMGFGPFGGHVGGVGYGAGLPVLPYGPIGLRGRRPFLPHTALAQGGLQLNIGAGMG